MPRLITGEYGYLHAPSPSSNWHDPLSCIPSSTYSHFAYQLGSQGVLQAGQESQESSHYRNCSDATCRMESRLVGPREFLGSFYTRILDPSRKGSLGLLGAYANATQSSALRRA